MTQMAQFTDAFYDNDPSYGMGVYLPNGNLQELRITQVIDVNIKKRFAHLAIKDNLEKRVPLKFIHHYLYWIEWDALFIENSQFFVKEYYSNVCLPNQ